MTCKTKNDLITNANDQQTDWQMNQQTDWQMDQQMDQLTDQQTDKQLSDPPGSIGVEMVGGGDPLGKWEEGELILPILPILPIWGLASKAWAREARASRERASRQARQGQHSYKHGSLKKKV